MCSGWPEAKLAGAEISGLITESGFQPEPTCGVQCLGPEAQISQGRNQSVRLIFRARLS
jgi:hypothetical protein